MEEKQVTSSHNITITADALFSEITDDADMLVLPGGIPGTPNLAAHEGLCTLLKKQFAAGKWVAAVCVAPTVLVRLGILEGKQHRKGYRILGISTWRERFLSSGNHNQFHRTNDRTLSGEI